MAGYDLVTFEKELNGLIPFHLAEKWDNVGLQVAGENIRVRRVLLTLDLDREVLRAARDGGFDLILSHHPLIFKPLSRILAFRNLRHSLIRELLCSNIACLALHTNMDKFFFSLISRKLRLNRIRPLTKEGFGSYGRLERPLALGKLISLLKENFLIRHLLYAGDEKRRVQTVASLGGSGGFAVTEALQEQKVDVLFTSDVKYHTAQQALDLGIALVSASHFDTENLMMPELKKLLDKKFGSSVFFKVSPCRTDPVKVHGQEVQ